MFSLLLQLPSGFKTFGVWNWSGSKINNCAIQTVKQVNISFSETKSSEIIILYCIYYWVIILGLAGLDIDFNSRILEYTTIATCRTEWQYFGTFIFFYHLYSLFFTLLENSQKIIGRSQLKCDHTSRPKDPQFWVPTSPQPSDWILFASEALR